MLTAKYIANLNLAAKFGFESLSGFFSIGLFFPSNQFSSGWDIVFAYCHTIRSTVSACAFVEILHFQCFDPTAHIQVDGI